MSTILPALRSGSLLSPLLGQMFTDVDRFPWPAEFSAEDTVGFRMDVTEFQDKYVLVADLPGRSTSEVDVTLHNRLLSIEVNPQQDSAKSDGNEARFIIRERRSGSMKRTISLPYAATASNVDATMKEGVLTVTIKKEESSMPKKITVR